MTKSKPLWNELSELLGRDPTRDELDACGFASVNYGKNKWRKKFRETLADHMARLPKGVHADNWRIWYFAPFGVPEWNAHITALRRIYAKEIPDSDFIQPTPFTLEKAMQIFGVRTDN